MDKELMKSDEQNATGSLQKGTASRQLTLSDAMVGPSLNAAIQKRGRPVVIGWICEQLDLANKITGGGMDEASLSYCAELIIDRFKGRTVNALQIAIRDGLNSGKIYGKLTYPIIAEWLIDHEEKIEAMNYSKHLSNK